MTYYPSNSGSTKNELARLTLQPGPPDGPASLAFRGLGLSYKASHKRYEFEYLWQVQVDVYKARGAVIIITPIACPWANAATFLRPWGGIMTDISARVCKKDQVRERGVASAEGRPEVRGEAEFHPFNAGKTGFLDALADDVGSQSYDPCFPALDAREVSHFEVLSLSGRRQRELFEGGRPWAPPHWVEPNYPWQDRQRFKHRFDYEMNPLDCQFEPKFGNM